MPSPFPGMDPFLERNPIFHELHTQILAEAQGFLPPQLRPKYIARLERHLSEGGVWELSAGMISLEGKEPDLTIAVNRPEPSATGSTAILAKPAVSAIEELDPDELELRKQRRIVIYLNSRPRLAITCIELLSPTNKTAGSVGQARYLEKRASALHGGMHWVEIDLLRGGQRPPMQVNKPDGADYLAYVAQATPTGWNHLLHTWCLPEVLPRLPIPLLGPDQVELDLAHCFRAAYDRTGADEDADYSGPPPAPALSSEQDHWVDQVLHQSGLR